MSRMEEYLEAIITGDNDDLPEPRSERERDYYEAAKRGLGGSGGGGEYFETVYGDTLTWDGNIDGKPFIEIDLGEDGIMYLVKVSDAIPTIDDLSNGIIATVAGVGQQEVPTEAITAGDGYISVEAMVIISAPNTTIEDMGLTFAETGIYLMSRDSMYVSELTINGYTGFESTRLKYEYLPVYNWEISEDELVAESTEKNYDVAYDTFVNGGTVIIATSFNSNPMYCRVLTAMVVDGAVMFLYADPTTAKVRLIGSFNGKFNQTT